MGSWEEASHDHYFISDLWPWGLRPLHLLISIQDTGQDVSFLVSCLSFLKLKNLLFLFGMNIDNKRESKQPNGCFSLRWTQYITA